jgi:hypothetical protein
MKKQLIIILAGFFFLGSATTASAVRYWEPHYYMAPEESQGNRSTSYQTICEEVRPGVTTCVDAHGRLVSQTECYITDNNKIRCSTTTY